MLLSTGTSLVAQWLRLCTSTAGAAVSIHGWGTKIPHATWYDQKNNNNTVIRHNDFCCVHVLSYHGRPDTALLRKIFPNWQSRSRLLNHPGKPCGLCSTPAFFQESEISVHAMQKLPHHQLPWATGESPQRQHVTCPHSLATEEISSTWLTTE